MIPAGARRAEGGEFHDAGLADAQAVVLHSKAYSHARQWLVHAGDDANPHGLLHALLRSPLGETLAAGTPGKRLQPLQLGIGLSQAGLRRLDLPQPVRAVLQSRAPAFAAGAAVRAAPALGDHARDAAAFWDARFAAQGPHLVLGLQARSAGALAQGADQVEAALREHAMDFEALPDCAWLAPQPGAPAGHWVHFGYRDALAKMHVRGWPYRPDGPGRAQHAAGEFLLGQRQDSGANPWALSDLPAYVRGFFHNASFGVLRHIEQDEAAFRAFLDSAATRLAAHLDAHGASSTLAPELRRQRLRGFVQAKLMGRWPNGQAMERSAHPEDAPPDTPVSDAFAHRGDADGQGCPLGAHIRRMNPRSGESSLVHSRRARVLLRRGMPYGPPYAEGEAPTARGLMGLFFCASLEDQFEHIVGQWGAGIALGSRDNGSAHDPFVAGQQPVGAQFALPLPPEAGGELLLPVPRSFVRTRGTAYLLYPSVPALWQLTQQGPWREERDDQP